MPNVLLGVTGSVAAIRTPALAAALREAGHAVRVVATDAATYFFDPAEVSGTPERDPEVVTLDADEWPGRGDGRRWERGEPVLHVRLRDWADVLVIAPLDANTLAKLACGLCDNCLTCVWRAWDTTRPVVLAPAMNTRMWEHSMTKRHLRLLAMDAGAAHVPGHLDDAQTIEMINARSPTLTIVAPIVKALACGDVGVGAMAEVPAVVEAVTQSLTSAPVAARTPPPR